MVLQWIVIGILVCLGSICNANDYVCVKPPTQQTGAWTSAMWHVGGGKQVLQLNSYVQGESRTGVLRSREFICPAKLSFRLAGHSHRNANFARLIDVETGKVLAELPSPGRDEALPVSWDLTQWQGRPVRMEVTDGDDGPSWAWISICEMQPELVPMPTVAGKLPDGWEEIPQPMQRKVVEGVPFISRSVLWSPGREGDSLKIPADGLQAEYLYLLGGGYTPDESQPGWGGSDDKICHFVGDQVGELRISYKDGSVDRVPLTFGFNVWWREPWRRSPEPFIGETPQAQAMRDSLCVYSPDWDKPWLMRIGLRPKAVQQIELVDNASKTGNVSIQGVSFGGCRELSSGMTAQPGEPMSATFTEWLKTHTIDGAKPMSAARKAALNKLKSYCDTDPSDFTVAGVKRTIAINPPMAFIGPKLSFDGPVAALVMGQVYEENSAELLSRIDLDGMVHESNKEADNYGAFGGVTPKLGPFYTAAYTRNRAALLLANVGLLTPANAAVNFWDKWLMYFPQSYPEIQMGGKPVPGHATVIANQPHVYFDSLSKAGWPTAFKTRDYGNPETDGHGILMLNRYRVWVKEGRSPKWTRDHWAALKEAAEWIPWCLDNPELSLSKNGLLYAESEGGMQTTTIYCDTPNYYGLLAYAEMADSIGEQAMASRWRLTAARLKRAIEAYYPASAKPFGDTWQPGERLWGSGDANNAPLLFAADLYGYDAASAMDPKWLKISQNTHRLQMSRKTPAGCSPTGFGYGQGYATESALLLDEMDDSALLLEWMAKLCYAPRQKNPFRVPEGATVKTDGSTWRRWGDLGNLFQMNEAVYTCQLLAGVDDTSPDELKLMPRIPTGWSGVELSDWPAAVKSGGQMQMVKLSMSVKCDASGPVSVTLKSSSPVDKVAVRVGPYASSDAADRMAVKMQSQGWAVSQVTSGQTKGKPAIWLWLKGSIR